jgi:N-acetylmuramoyl-L-alanine amidase
MTPRGAGSTDADGHVRLSDYQRLPGNAHDVFNILLGHEIHRQIIQLNPNDSEADRGLKRARFVVLKDNPLPAVLVEGGFLTNRMEAAVVDHPEYRQALAAAICRGIQNFVKVLNGDAPLAPVIAQSPTATPPKPSPHTTPQITTAPDEPQTAPSSAIMTTPSKPSSNEPTVTIYPTAPSTSASPLKKAPSEEASEPATGPTLP